MSGREYPDRVIKDADWPRSNIILVRVVMGCSGLVN